MMRLLKDRRGASAVEYSLIASLIAAAIVGIVTDVGGGVNQTFHAVAEAIEPTPKCGPGYEPFIADDGGEGCRPIGG